MTELTVRASGTYTVRLERGGLANLGHLLQEAPRAAAIIAEEAVDQLYGDRAAASLEAAGVRVERKTFPGGEAEKCGRTLFEILEFLAERKLSRSDMLVALGGGVTGDLTGFAAAVYLRGVPFVQVPTTLLSMVDASVGGKTAVNLNAGKNLAGAFYQPDCVLADTDTLSTLPARELASGMGEVIKYAVIRDASLLALANDLTDENLEEAIARCIAIKRDVVGRDEKETGERQILNFGHTFGHAIEACSRYSLPHGAAVAAGMVLMTRAAVKKGLCGGQCLRDLADALTRRGLPTGTAYGQEEIFSCMLSDKKRASEKITLIVPRAMGTCERVTVTLEEAGAWLRLGLEEEA